MALELSSWISGVEGFFSLSGVISFPLEGEEGWLALSILALEKSLPEEVLVLVLEGHFFWRDSN